MRAVFFRLPPFSWDFLHFRIVFSQYMVYTNEVTDNIYSKNILLEGASLNIIVLCGGISTERDVSIVSGRKAAETLRKLGHRAVLVDLFSGYTYPYDRPEDVFTQEYHDDAGVITADVPDLEALARSRGGSSRIGANVPELCAAADIVFMGLHGSDGEDGKVQAMFELLGIKYTGSDSLGSALAMNKGLTKQIFLQNGVNTPSGVCIRRSDMEKKAPGFPCVVKPQSGGSSVGTSIVGSEEEFRAALELAFRYDDTVIVEQYIKGREFAVGVIDGRALPAIEIRPKQGFFDYKNKYLDGMTDEICPADIPGEVEQRLRAAAVEVFRALQLKVYARIDFIVDGTGREWCLEANTLPGLTPASLMPKEAAAAGISYEDFISQIIEISLEKYR